MESLREIAAGAVAATYGALPLVPLPTDNVLQREFNKQLHAILKSTHLYRRDSIIVIPNDDKKRLDLINPETFITWAEDHLIPYKTRSTDQGPIMLPKSMSKDTAKNYLADIKTRTHTREIKTTYPLPMPIHTTAQNQPQTQNSSSSSLELTTPGYHTPSSTYTFPPDWTANSDSEHYYDETITLSEARDFLTELHKDFPFSDWKEHQDEAGRTIRTSRSLACQIGAMITLFGSALVPQTASRMGFLFNANSPRSGKTLLAKIAIYTTFGSFKAQPWRHNDEDMLKILDASTLASTNYICFDNVRGKLASQPLEGFMTTPTWTGRVLGKSEMFEAENNATIFITGNNMNIGTDVAQRFLTIDLNIEEANIQDRKPPEKLINETWLTDTTNRRKILSCLWTIIRHWDAADQPIATGKPYLGFEQWCNTIGGIVEFAGFGDMLERPVLENSGDTEYQDIQELIRISIGLTSRRLEYTFQQLVNTLYKNELLPWKLKGKEIYISDGNGDFDFKLDTSAAASVGHLLSVNYANSEKGRLYKIPADPDNGNHTLRHIRFSTNGKKGRQKKFILEDQTPVTA